MSDKMTASLSSESTSTKSTAKAELSELAAGTFTVKGGDTGTGPISARIVCQPAGSNVYYSDTRDAAGVLHIDMTKEIQY